MIHDLDILLNGEQLLATEIMKIIPLIEKHFKPFDGKKARILSGDSAAYQKIQTAFKEDVETFANMNVFIDGMNIQWLNAKVKLSSGNDKGRHYFDTAFCIGDIDSVTGVFSYDYNERKSRQRNQQILYATKFDVDDVKTQIEELENQIETLTRCVAAPFQHYIKG